MDFINQVSIREEVMQYRRGYVVRQVSVEPNATSGRDSAEVGLQNVPRHNRQIRMLLCQTFQAFHERRVELYGVNRGAAANQMLGHLAMTGADFNPAVVSRASGGKCLHSL